MNLLTLWILALGAVMAPAETRPAAPGAPRERVEIPRHAPAGRTLHVPAGGSFQSALDEARPGDVIELGAGAVYSGPFLLRRKTGDDWILIRSDAPAAVAPGAPSRVAPADESRMPRLVSSKDAVVSTEPGAHHYRFLEIEMSPAPGSFLTNVALIGHDETTSELQPHHIIFERCYVHGDPVLGSRRGIALNARYSAVIGSWLSDFKEAGADSQAIAIWNGAGPLRIEGNHLEAAGENLMIGGADPAVKDLVPADIEIRRNRLSKPLAWKQEGRWSVKNLLELKNARRVLIEGNLLERNWAQAQNGFAVLFTVRNQDGHAPWAAVEDVLFANNAIVSAGSGVNILGRDDAAPSGRARRIGILNNLFTDIDGKRWGGSGTLFQILEGTEGLRIEHNTARHSGATIVAEGAPHRGFVYRANLTSLNQYGIVGTGTAPDGPTISAYFPGSMIEGNSRFSGERPPAAPSSSRTPRAGADVAAVCAALAPEDRPAAGCSSPAPPQPSNKPPRHLSR